MVSDGNVPRIGSGMMTEPTVPVYFAWNSFMPDHRQYKQNSIVLNPADIYVQVDVPLKRDYITNTEKLLVNGLYAEKGDPILTPLGMRYCMDQLESVLPDVPLKSTDFEPDLEEDDGWDKGEDDIRDEKFGWK